MAQSNRKNNNSSNDMSSADFRLMLQALAEEAEHKLPGPPPEVKKLHKQQQKKTRKLTVILLLSVALLAVMLVWGVKNADDLPLGLGGILKAYTVGTKAPIPQPGEQLKPSQKPRPMDPEKWGKR